jgi:hypothetical protein
VLSWLRRTPPPPPTSRRQAKAYKWEAPTFPAEPMSRCATVCPLFLCRRVDRTSGQGAHLVHCYVGSGRGWGCGQCTMLSAGRGVATQSLSWACCRAALSGRCSSCHASCHASSCHAAVVGGGASCCSLKLLKCYDPLQCFVAVGMRDVLLQAQWHAGAMAGTMAAVYRMARQGCCVAAVWLGPTGIV